MRVIIQQDDMTLDLVVWQAFGRQDEGVVEQAFSLNPGLEAVGSILPIGTVVELPEPQAPKPAKRDSVRLWG